jgi:uncharacterized coiled-coil DUF342 family protein
MGDLDVELLRKEIEDLKKRTGASTNSEDLSKSINSLMRIFAEASEDLKIDTHDAVLVGQKLDGLIDRLDKIESQNEKIAKGIVALADMVEELSAGRIQANRDIRNMPKPSVPPSSKPLFGGLPAKPLPSYNVPKDEEKKKSFLNFNM